MTRESLRPFLNPLGLCAVFVLCAVWPGHSGNAALPPPAPSPPPPSSLTAPASATVTDEALLKKKISRHDEKVPLGKWLEHLSTKENLNLSAGDLDWKKEITLDLADTPLRDILDKAGEQAGFSWRMKRGVLTLKKRSGDYFTLMSDVYGKEAADYLAMSPVERKAFLDKQMTGLFSSLTDVQKADWKRQGGLTLATLSAAQMRNLQLYSDAPRLEGFLPDFQFMQKPHGIRLAIGYLPGETHPSLQITSSSAPNSHSTTDLGIPEGAYTGNRDLPALEP